MKQPGTGQQCAAHGCENLITPHHSPNPNPKKYCRNACRAQAQRDRQPHTRRQPPVGLNGRLALVWAACETNAAGCLIPPQHTVTYQIDEHTKRTENVYRAAFRLYGDPTGRPVHHICAGGRYYCCNPQHLQLVTPEQNQAEMLGRTAYQTRIRLLENQLLALGETLERFHFFNPPPDPTPDPPPDSPPDPQTTPKPPPKKAP